MQTETKLEKELKEINPLFKKIYSKGNFSCYVLPNEVKVINNTNPSISQTAENPLKTIVSANVCETYIEKRGEIAKKYGLEIIHSNNLLPYKSSEIKGDYFVKESKTIDEIRQNIEQVSYAHNELKREIKKSVKGLVKNVILFWD